MFFNTFNNFYLVKVDVSVYFAFRREFVDFVVMFDQRSEETLQYLTKPRKSCLQKIFIFRSTSKVKMIQYMTQNVFNSSIVNIATTCFCFNQTLQFFETSEFSFQNFFCLLKKSLRQSLFV